MQKILVTGGAGYVGAVLVPKLLRNNYQVHVLDLMIYGEDVLPSHPNLKTFKGDIRNLEILSSALEEVNTVIHLAAISNDPSFELDPRLAKSINFDSFRPMLDLCQKKGVTRFINASSSSVYGVKKETNVTENLILQPLTDYSYYKAECEKILLTYNGPDFTTVSIRPATVCGYSPRQRMDVIVNIFTNFALNQKSLTVHGGTQLRPNIHIDDITNLYLQLCHLPSEKISGKIFNAGARNYPLIDIAKMVCKTLDFSKDIKTTQSNDLRSYHISSEKIQKELNFHPRKTIPEAINDIKSAYQKGLLTNTLDDKRYFNIKMMKAINLS